MSNSAVITTRLDTETLASLDALAIRLGRSRARVAAEAIADYVKEQAAFLDFLQEGEDAIERGDYITHEELIAEIRSRQAGRQAA